MLLGVLWALNQACQRGDGTATQGVDRLTNGCQARRNLAEVAGVVVADDGNVIGNL